MTPLKAIRQKCLECCCNQTYEVKECVITSCPLYIYRMGKNPARAGIGGTGNKNLNCKNVSTDTGNDLNM